RPVTTGALLTIRPVPTVGTVPAPAGVTSGASPPVPTAVDIDHGRGRDRDDTIHKHPGRGKALGHPKRRARTKSSAGVIAETTSASWSPITRGRGGRPGVVVDRVALVQ